MISHTLCHTCTTSMSIPAATMPRPDTRYGSRTWAAMTQALSDRKPWAERVSLHVKPLSFFPWKRSSRDRWVTTMADPLLTHPCPESLPATCWWGQTAPLCHDIWLLLTSVFVQSSWSEEDVVLHLDRGKSVKNISFSLSVFPQVPAPGSFKSLSWRFLNRSS